MSFSAIEYDDRAVDVAFSEKSVRFVLADGREISAPLAWFPKLQNASTAERKNWKLIGKGVGVHWPSIDEDISVSALMHTKSN